MRSLVEARLSVGTKELTFREHVIYKLPEPFFVQEIGKENILVARVRPPYRAKDEINVSVFRNARAKVEAKFGTVKSVEWIPAEEERSGVAEKGSWLDS
jgi:hypothetical protein